MASEPHVTSSVSAPKSERLEEMPPSFQPKKRLSCPPAPVGRRKSGGARRGFIRATLSGGGVASNRPADGDQPERSVWAWLRETLFIAVVALAVSFLLKTFLIQAFFIPSSSMENTLQVYDRILVNKTVSKADISRGDLVVFRDPGGWLPPVPQEPSALKRFWRDTLIAIGIMPADAGEHLVKRVIGLPGDTVECCGVDGKLKVNGVAITEPYLKPGVTPSEIDFSVKVPPNHAWMMGDNRSNSRDSRAYIGAPGGGFISLDSVVGRAFVIMWPYSHWGSLTGGSKAFTDVPGP